MAKDAVFLSKIWTLLKKTLKPPRIPSFHQKGHHFPDNPNKKKILIKIRASISRSIYHWYHTENSSLLSKYVSSLKKANVILIHT